MVEDNTDRGWKRRTLLKSVSGAAVATTALTGTGTVAGDSVRQEVEVSMSDGVTIRGDIYYPADNSGGIADGPFPVIVTFNPYNEGSDETSGTSVGGGGSPLVPHGYISANFDVRGTGRSGGQFRLLGPREQEDYGTLIHWLADLERATGDVGLYGASYLAMNQFPAARAAGPDSPVKAMFPMVSGVDTYRDVLFPGGMWGNYWSTTWLGGLTSGVHSVSPVLAADEMSPEEVVETEQDHLAGAYQSGLSTIIGGNLGTGRGYREEFWRKRSYEYAFPDIVDWDIPVFTIQGWHDIFQPGAAQIYAQFQNLWADRDQFGAMEPNQPVSGKYQAVIGPYYHTSTTASTRLQKLWFDRWLKGKRNGIEKTERPLHLFQVFGKRWVDVATWPLPDAGTRQVETYYLDAGPSGTAPHSLNDGVLRQAKPAGSTASDALPWRRHNPCSQGMNEEQALGLAPSTPCTADSRTFETGTLTYTTPAFDEGRNIAGPLSLTLYASADTTNTSWAVMVSDVAPDGSSTKISKGQLLGSHRAVNVDRSWFVQDDQQPDERRRRGSRRAAEAVERSEGRNDAADSTLIRPMHDYTREAEQPVEPGAVEQYDILLDPIFARIRPGHRLRLAIRPNASWAQPLAHDLDDVVGTYHVQRTRTHGSAINIPFVSGPLPESPTDWGPCPVDCGSRYRED